MGDHPRQLEEFALASHQRAVRAIDEGRFEREITPVGDVAVDEGPRRDTSMEKMAGLEPLREGWELTAATASRSPTARPRCWSPPRRRCSGTG